MLKTFLHTVLSAKHYCNLTLSKPYALPSLGIFFFITTVFRSSGYRSPDFYMIRIFFFLLASNTMTGISSPTSEFINMFLNMA